MFNYICLLLTEPHVSLKYVPVQGLSKRPGKSQEDSVDSWLEKISTENNIANEIF